MRTKFVAGNWKMFTTTTSAVQLARGVVQGCAGISGVNVAVCPPFPFLGLVAEAVRGSQVALGAQNLYPDKEGAYTGEVSPTMLLDVGCQWVILGHSERRHKLGEDDAFINRKVHAALAAGLRGILCIGETLEEREAGKTEAVLKTQIAGGLKGVAANSLSCLVIAYEPVWAIGTGRVASAADAQEVCKAIRDELGKLASPQLAAGVRVLYGGSVNAKNVGEIAAQEDVDGALVGGASLDGEQFATLSAIAAGGPLP
jgi:triosephosphate isomerase (TIM)